MFFFRFLIFNFTNVDIFSVSHEMMVSVKKKEKKNENEKFNKKNMSMVSGKPLKKKRLNLV